MPALRRLLYLTFAIATCVASHAQVTVTYNVLPGSTRYSLVQGQPGTWTFTLNSDPNAGRGTYSSVQAGSSYSWNGNAAALETPVFTSFGGDLFSGTFNAANMGPTQLMISNIGNVTSVIFATSGQNLGISFNGEFVTGLQIGGRFGTFAPSIDSTLPDLATYMAANSGTYTNFLGQYVAIYTTNGYYNLYGGPDFSSVTVATAIPEPSTYAALLGACAIGLVALRRRRA